MNEYGKSDSLIVPEKHLNKGSVNPRPAEGVEERRLGEGKLRGHYQYYAVRHNSRALNDVLYHVKRAWQYWLSKRSHRGLVIWDYFERVIIKKYPLPRPRIIHQI